MWWRKKKKPSAEAIERYNAKYILSTDTQSVGKHYVEKYNDKNEEERPLAFYTNDPTIYVYEYSDRFEYYKREGDTMILVNADKKEK